MKGLVLEGGGAKGAFHCGVVKALYDNGYEFDGVAGASIGAINAALIVQDCGYESLFDVWMNISAEDIMEINDLEVNKLENHEINKETISYWSKKAQAIIKNKGIPTDKILKYLHTVIDEDKVRNSPMELAITTYCLSNMKPLELLKNDIPKGELHNFLMASAYYPAFRFNRLNEKFYFDGGIFNNLPLNILPDKKGYDEIYAIRTMSKMPYKNTDNTNVKVNYICPSEDLGKAYNVGKKFLNYKIKLGYNDALKFIKGYHGYKYYLNGDIELFKEIFIPKNESERRELCEILNINLNNFDKEIKNKLKSDFKIKNIDNEIYLGFFEDIAKKFNVEKFKIYNEKSFLTEIKENAINDFPKEKFLKGTSEHIKQKIKLYNFLQKRMTEAINGTL